MPEAQQQAGSAAQGAPEAQAGNDPKPTANEQAPASIFDPKALPDDEFEKVFDDERLFKHNRFRELAAQAKEAKILKEEKEKIEEEKLRKNGEYEKLLAKREEELNSYKENARKAQIDNKIQQLLFQEDVVDADAALVLINRSKIGQDDAGNLIGIKEAVEELKQTKKYLFNGSQAVRVGANPGSQDGMVTQKFRLSQLEGIEGRRFFEKNKEAIMAAKKAGNLIDDTQSRTI